MKRLQIGIHNFCNRVCPWCIYGYEEKEPYREMDETLFRKILEDSKEIENLVTIDFTHFFEPFYNIDLLRKYVKIIREYYPDIHIRVDSNGDYLTKEALEDLPIDFLKINDYDCLGFDAMMEKFKELKVMYMGVNNVRSYEYDGIHKTIKTVRCAPDWPKNLKIEDKAGYLIDKNVDELASVIWKNSHNERTEPCPFPEKYIIVDWDGNVCQCCNMKYTTHKEYFIGNVKNSSLKEIIETDKAKKFLEAISNVETLPECCKYCAKGY